MASREDVLKLIPEAVVWAQGLQDRAIETGQPLSEPLLRIARSVGVQQPEKIRLVLTDLIPVPEEQRLKEAAFFLGFLGPNSIGLTLGHAVFIREIYFDRRVFAHECRHVFQYEQAGSIAAFLPQFVSSIMEFGYFYCPFEEDARSIEGLVLPDDHGG